MNNNSPTGSGPRAVSKEGKTSHLVRYTSFTIIFFGLALTIGTLYAWNPPPSGVPPTCPSGQPGCDAPINVGNTFQSKDGNLTVNALGTFATGFSVPFGKVGIGTASPAGKLAVYSRGENQYAGYFQGTYGVYADNDAGYYAHLANSSWGLLTNGNIQAAAFYYASDESLKKNIQTIPNALADVLQLRGVEFDWKNPTIEGSTHSVGVIAQEVEKVYPELVTTNLDGLKSVQYGNLVGPLIEAVKTLKAENDALRARVEKLEAKN